MNHSLVMVESRTKRGLQLVTSWNSQCDSCKHYLGDTPRPRCEAYPQGINREIIMNLVLHTRPIPGDKGIVWEPVDKSTPPPRQMSREDFDL